MVINQGYIFFQKVYFIPETPVLRGYFLPGDSKINTVSSGEKRAAGENFWGKWLIIAYFG